MDVFGTPPSYSDVIMVCYDTADQANRLQCTGTCPLPHSPSRRTYKHTRNCFTDTYLHFITRRGIYTHAWVDIACPCRPRTWHKRWRLAPHAACWHMQRHRLLCQSVLLRQLPGRRSPLSFNSIAVDAHCPTFHAHYPPSLEGCVGSYAPAHTPFTTTYTATARRTFCLPRLPLRPFLLLCTSTF